MLPPDIDELEWHQRRLGKVTASRIADVVAKTRSGWGASRANYMAQLVAERLTGARTDGFTSAAMQWGIDQEPLAIAMYSFEHDAHVTPSDFVDHPTVEMSGASPDGLVGSEGMVEVKCPLTATHIDTLLNESIPEKYLLQMQWQMACCGRQWVDYCSFDPRMPADLQLWVKRVDRDDSLISELEGMVAHFLDELAEKVKRLQELRAA